MSNRWQRGSFYEAHGAWHVRYYQNKKQVSRRLCDGDATKKQVRQAFTEFMAKVNDEQHSPTSNLTVTKFWDDTYLPFILANLKPSTSLSYKLIWTGRLKEHFGTTPMGGYRTSTMSNFLTSLAKTLRPRTLATIKTVARSLFAHAVATGACESNPIRDARVLGKTLENGVTGSYTLEEIENVISALVDFPQAQLIMALSFFLGLRRGEITGLQWGDVDGGFIHVRRAETRGVVGTPKTLKSVRSVPIIEPLRLLLTLQKRDGVWLFPDKTGEAPIDLGVYAKKVIIPTLRAAGLQWKGFHAGRRGLGTTLRALTGNSNAGRDVLGHSTTAVTEAHYEHAMPEEALKGMRLLEEKVGK
jgi:integrase